MSDQLLYAIPDPDPWKDGDFYMSGEGYLTPQGQMRVDITTWTLSWGLGFTGGCILAVMDANENNIYQWLIWPLGVDAKSIWWKRSRRTDHPYEQLDPALAAQAARIELWPGRMEKDRWDSIIAEVGRKGGDVLDLYKRFALGGGG